MRRQFRNRRVYISSLELQALPVVEGAIDPYLLQSDDMWVDDEALFPASPITAEESEDDFMDYEAVLAELADMSEVPTPRGSFLTMVDSVEQLHQCAICEDPILFEGMRFRSFRELGMTALA